METPSSVIVEMIDSFWVCYNIVHLTVSILSHAALARQRSTTCHSNATKLGN